MRRTYLTCVFFLVTLSSYAQKSTVIVDLQNLEGKEDLYISDGIELRKVTKERVVEFSIEHLPTLLYIETINKKGKIVIRKLLWIETSNVSVAGSFLTDKFEVSPSAKEQEVTDKVLTNLKKIDLDSELFVSRPYLVYLSTRLPLSTAEYLQKVVSQVPEKTKSFWATKKIETYLGKLESVGFNLSTKEFKYVIAKNKKGEDQKFRQDKSKFLVLDFGSSGCVPCLEDIKRLRELNDQHGEKIELLSIWKDPSQDIWLNVASKQKEKINWTSLQDETGATFKGFDVKSYPTYMVVDTSGYVVKTFFGFNKLERFITKQL
jgi:thiol-disulfide isomerase/thioredoxin